MSFIEKDLESIIFDAMKTSDGRLDLDRRGLPLFDHIHYVPKRRLRIGEYGIIDILLSVYGYDYTEEDSQWTHYVINIKTVKIGLKALLQASTHAAGIRDYTYFHRRDKMGKVIMVIICPELDPDGDCVFLMDQMENLEVFTYKTTLTGILFKRFNPYIYSRVDKGFGKGGCR